MTTALSIRSEIGPLKTVLLHRPGEELLNLSPGNLDALLFDDIPYLEVAQQEHDCFAQMLAERGVEVLYLEKLVEEALTSSPQARDAFIAEYVACSGLEGETLTGALTRYLQGFDSAKELVAKAISGIRPDELNLTGKPSSLVDVAAREDARKRLMLVDPIPNLYFTRDTFSVIGEAASINCMWSPIRKRETVFAHSIFSYHPRYKACKRWYDEDDAFNIEGGDILILSNELVCIGVSERSSAAAVDILARRLLLAPEGEGFSKVLAFLIPHTRAFMHLDTVFTQADVDTFVVHAQISDKIKLVELSRGANNTVTLKTVETPLDKALADALGLASVRLITCGGEDPIAAAREQWNDGSNTLAVKPGTILVYQRNQVTNDILYKAGLELLEIPSAELLRGRGGPHCMSMALSRASL